MLRILLVTNGLRHGGAERVVEALAVDLASRGDAVSVVATTRDGPIGESLRNAGIPVHVLGLRLPFDLRVPLALARIARTFAPDVIHSHLAVADIATASGALVAPGPMLVTTVHNTGIELGPLKLALWRAALRRFHRVIAVSDRVRASLDASLDATVIRPSLVDPADPAMDRARARAVLGVDLATPLVMAIGRLEPVKGFDLLARAAPMLTVPGVRILVIGDGSERQNLTGTPLELLGDRGDAASLLPAADVVVCPSRSEGLPQVPLHAMAAARPVVATRVGGTPEVVVDGETGLLVEPESPAALAAALDELLGDPGRAARLGAAGLGRLAASGPSRATMLRETRAVYASRP